MTIKHEKIFSKLHHHRFMKTPFRYQFQDIVIVQVDIFIGYGLVVGKGTYNYCRVE